MIDTYWRLNLDSREMQRQAANIAEMHRNVCTMLGNDRASAGALWALDKGRILIIRSHTMPDSDALDDALGIPDPALAFIASAPVPERFDPGRIHRFQLTASNVKVDNITKKRVPVQAESWIQQRAAQCGFRVESLTARTRKLRGGRTGKTILISAAHYTGTLTVTDAELFGHTMRFGIGKGKAYGCGLLTID